MTTVEAYLATKQRIEDLNHELMVAIVEHTLAKRQMMSELSGVLVSLTYRERQVMELVRQGMQNKEIADRLNISLRTVKHHVTNILAKHGVESRRYL